ncbi:hypothetical protein G9A89_002934 [Geosiphon pyriformis]|nr:hypothetical protein G9A89_002934 [Geosiphon pyriformis]
MAGGLEIEINYMSEYNSAANEISLSGIKEIIDRKVEGSDVLALVTFLDPAIAQRWVNETDLPKYAVSLWRNYYQRKCSDPERQIQTYIEDFEMEMNDDEMEIHDEGIDNVFINHKFPSQTQDGAFLHRSIPRSNHLPLTFSKKAENETITTHPPTFEHGLQIRKNFNTMSPKSKPKGPLPEADDFSKVILELNSSENNTQDYKNFLSEFISQKESQTDIPEKKISSCVNHIEPETKFGQNMEGENAFDNQILIKEIEQTSKLPQQCLKSQIKLSTSQNISEDILDIINKNSNSLQEMERVDETERITSEFLNETLQTDLYNQPYEKKGCSKIDSFDSIKNPNHPINQEIERDEHIGEFKKRSQESIMHLPEKNSNFMEVETRRSLKSQQPEINAQIYLELEKKYSDTEISRSAALSEQKKHFLEDQIERSLKFKKPHANRNKTEGETLIPEKNLLPITNYECLKKKVTSGNMVDDYEYFASPKQRFSSEPQEDLLNLCREKEELHLSNVIPLTYAEVSFLKGVEAYDLSFFSMEAIGGNMSSARRLKAEADSLKWNEMVGMIFLDEEGQKYCWFAFYTTARTCDFFALPKLRAPFFLISRKITNPRPRHLEINSPELLQILSTNLFDVKICMAALFSLETRRGEQLRLICESRPAFVVFGGIEHSEVEDIICAAKGFGGHYFKEAENQNITAIFSDCHFYIFGWEIGEKHEYIIEEVFKPGGKVTFTTNLVQLEPNVVQKVNQILMQRNYFRPKENWEIVLHPQVQNRLERITTKWLLSNPECPYFDIWDLKDFGKLKILEDIDVLPCERGGSCQDLYKTMLRQHTIYHAKYRHFIVLARAEEIERCPPLPIPGV